MLAHVATMLSRAAVVRRIAVPPIVLAASVGCARPDVPAREAELRSAITTFRTSLNGGDSTAFFRLLAPDLEVIAPGAQPIRGAEAHASFRPLFTELKADIGPFTDEEITMRDDIAIQRHSYRLSTSPRVGGPVKTVNGSGLHVWKRLPDGRWQIVKDIWSIPSSS